MRNHRTRKPYRLASRCRVAGNERSPRRRSSKAAAYPRPVARKEHLMWSAGGTVLRCGAEADTVCTKGTGYRTNRARTQRNVWPDVFLVRMASAGVVLGAGRCACEEPCVCGDIGQPRAFHRTRRPGSGPAGGARIFQVGVRSASKRFRAKCSRGGGDRWDNGACDDPRAVCIWRNDPCSELPGKKLHWVRLAGSACGGLGGGFVLRREGDGIAS